MLAFFCATPVGSAVAGPVFEKIGYIWTFGIGASCNLIAVAYAVFFIKETVKALSEVYGNLGTLVALISPLMHRAARLGRLRCLMRLRRHRWLRQLR